MKISVLLRLIHYCLACLIALSPNIQAKSNLPQNETSKRKPIVIHGVEKQRRRDNDYDGNWLRVLKERGHNPITYSNKEEMLRQITTLTGKNKCISELNLYGHGYPGQFGVGLGQRSDYRRSTYILAESSAKRFNLVENNDWRTALKPLIGRFCNGGVVTLTACEVGADEAGAELIFEMSKFFRVRVKGTVNIVYAPLEKTSQDYDGPWQEARPNMQAPPKVKKPTIQERQRR